LFCGVTSLVIGGIEVMAPGPGSTALFVGIGAPLMLIALAAMLLGIVLAIQYAASGLLVLSGLTVFFVVAMIGEYGPVNVYDAGPFIYGCIAVAISTAGLVKHRQRRR
jgi:hypothetical protein